VDIGQPAGCRAPVARDDHRDWPRLGGGFRLAHPEVAWVEADARALPFADGSFELVHCNAVVEHLPPDDQRLLLAECCRVAHRAAFVATPNRWFPIEVHTRIPFVHWLPWSVGGPLIRRCRPVLGRDLWLLTPGRLRALVPTSHAVQTVRRGMTIVVIVRPR
jgi:SAM-dependent methyltransferase